MKILVGMNLSPLGVPFLVGRGFETVHWSDVGMPSAPGTEIVAYALAHGYVIFTHDLDFGALLAAHGGKGPSVIQVRAQDLLPCAIGELVTRALKLAATQLKKGALVTIDPRRQRIRMLPI